jgi:hypothetical protein
MGQQQLLLIVIGVIVVGFAIIVAINLLSAEQVSGNRDAVVNDLSNIAAMAHKYYSTPSSAGGGGYSFANYTLPASMVSDANGAYSILTAGTATGITMQGVGNQIASGSNYVTVQIFVRVPPLTDSVAVVY